MRLENTLAKAVGAGSSSESVRSVATERQIQSAEGTDVALDTVKLSNARDLVALAKNADPADRQARIASLTAQVRSGTYQVDAQAVARSIIRDLG